MHSSKLTSYPPERALPTQGLSANTRMAHKMEALRLTGMAGNPQSEPAPAEALYSAVASASLTIGAERCTELVNIHHHATTMSFTNPSPMQTTGGNILNSSSKNPQVLPSSRLSGPTPLAQKVRSGVRDRACQAAGT